MVSNGRVNQCYSGPAASCPHPVRPGFRFAWKEATLGSIRVSPYCLLRTSVRDWPTGQRSNAPDAIPPMQRQTSLSRAAGMIARVPDRLRLRCPSSEPMQRLIGSSATSPRQKADTFRPSSLVRSLSSLSANIARKGSRLPRAPSCWLHQARRDRDAESAIPPPLRSILPFGAPFPETKTSAYSSK